MENFKEKKLAKFRADFTDVEMGNFYSKNTIGKRDIGKPYFVEQFISDLIDETETNLFLKDIVTKARIDTLKAVLPEEVKLILRGKDGKEFNATKELGVGSIGKGFNNCRNEVINKAKELGNIDLTK